MLEQIIATKRKEVEALILPEPLRNVQRRSLSAALKKPNRFIGLIAEVKKASPSKGLIRPDFHPAAIAKAYEKAGADAISVLTDERYFQGHRSYLSDVKQAVQLPVLRKDFIIHRMQIEESVRIGADAILLIGEALPAKTLYELYQEARDKGLECLVEVHQRETLESILDIFTPEIIGINNRNLHTFVTTLETTSKVIPFVPDGSVIVSESGIAASADLQAVKTYGANAVLVGEALMRKDNVEAAIYELFQEVGTIGRPS
ncbi:indole-3-glycerol phosphate synthase TrpC [Parageobacillus thermoglucosidasius]|uniref:Indole-3-glycerol phosphate synthase n=2 Tax=Anoxybacillaceae TaxID=3120669 RepID=A0AAN0YQ52_PARTM|nr:indole-3-glycerol phosphate synthase TrpC [Parageobacillus thermoglucosidasius]AEH47451.1 Indole-3-glycerol-phosphate synthase [Parageobacillus thermoglucosidasius C56-YS93]ALF11310.1 indole-3-glycerol phosphate synthase [Parageobacillus thermoglucosidasius]ANZ31387.1 indole-3-glycerol phosphate synthase [Parageobacillus thermoglucosidasius]APM82125.1 indole-3-glycerol phosphate synthase [Parageobacillus thermoglucosidasius]KJX68040.1 indole-3-glycerol phosphate synthase [Parageobacillus th